MCAHVVRDGQPHEARPVLKPTVHLWPARDLEGTSYLPVPTRSARRPSSPAFATATTTLCARLLMSTLFASMFEWCWPASIAGSSFTRGSDRRPRTVSAYSEWTSGRDSTSCRTGR